MSWEEVSLGELEGGKGNFVDGPFGSNLKASEYIATGVPLIQLKNIKTNQYIDKDLKFVSQDKAESLKRHSYQAGDVCIAKLGAVGTACLIPESAPSGIIVADVVRFRGDKTRIDYKYLCYFLNSSIGQQRILVFSRGSTRTRTNLGDLKKVQIPLPPLDEQKRIAAILDKADAIRQKRKQAIELADEFLRSVFLDMFGDPVTNPKGWEVKKLSDYGNFKNGMNYSKSEKGKELHCIGVGDFKSLDRLIGASSLSKIQLNELPDSGYFLRNNDLLFVRSNGNKALVGRCLSVHPGEEKVTYSGFCIRYRIDSQQCLNTDYVNYCLRIPSMKHAMLRGGQGANIQNINQQILSNLPIPIPSIELQQEFSAIVATYRKLEQRAIANQLVSQAMFNSLSQKAFSGQL